MWNVGGMIIPEENRSVLKKTYSKATTATANTTWTLLNADRTSEWRSRLALVYGTAMLSSEL
jgi:hypothetical protein